MVFGRPQSNLPPAPRSATGLSVMHAFLTAFIAVLFLAGCAAFPPIPQGPTSPAHAQAPEGARRDPINSLQADEATLKTQALLSAARKEQEYWDAYGPVSGSPELAPAPEDYPRKHHGRP